MNTHRRRHCSGVGIIGMYMDCNAILPGGHMEDDAMAAKLWAVSEELTRPYLAPSV